MEGKLSRGRRKARLIDQIRKNREMSEGKWEEIQEKTEGESRDVWRLLGNSRVIPLKK